MLDGADRKGAKHRLTANDHELVQVNDVRRGSDDVL